MGGAAGAGAPGASSGERAASRPSALEESLHSLVAVPPPARGGAATEAGAPPAALALPVPRFQFRGSDVAPPAEVAAAAAGGELGGGRAGGEAPGAPALAAAAAALWCQLRGDVAAKFGGYALSLWPRGPVNRHALLRRLSARCGLQLAAVSRDWSSAQPPRGPLVAPGDVRGFAPVVKSALASGPAACPEAHALYARGCGALAAGDVPAAYLCILEAYNAWVAAGGYACAEVAAAAQALGLVLAAAGDAAGAAQQQRRACAILAAVGGCDALPLARARGQLSHYLGALGAHSAACRAALRSLLALELACPRGHPELLAGGLRLGQLLTEGWHVRGAAAVLAATHARAAAAGDVPTLAAALHLLSLNAALVGGFKDAIAHQKRILALFAPAGGPPSGGPAPPPAQGPGAEALKWIAAFTRKALELERMVRDQAQAQAQAQAQTAAAAQAATAVKANGAAAGRRLGGAPLGGKAGTKN